MVQRRAVISWVLLLSLTSALALAQEGQPQDLQATLRAGAAQADITPPPGLPHWGHSVEATKRAKGYWTRLYARAFVLVDGWETKVALVQLDLGASSALLLEKVAELLTDLSFGRGQIVLLASHTHAGPGGYFGHGFYNRFAAGRCGFDPALVDWLAVRIASAVKTAYDTARPAGIGIGTARIDGVSRNRSLTAWRKNFEGQKPPYSNGLLPYFTLLRIDHWDGRTSKPIGALAFLPLHATAVEAKTPYYQGDVAGVVERQVAGWIQKEYQTREAPIVGSAAGPQGDVSPDWSTQSEGEARRLGAEIAEELNTLFSSLDGRLEAVKLQVRSVDLQLAGGKTSKGYLCNRATLGVPLLAGSEDGRSFLHGKFGVIEGRARKKPRGCQGHKVRAFGSLQHLFLGKKLFPPNVPMQYVRFGDLAALSTVPGEPTTEAGKRISKAISDSIGLRQVIVAAHGSDYAGYFTTSAEFRAQHYEGGSTLYGPWSQLLLEETAAKLASGTASGTKPPSARPGRAKKLFPRKSCDIKKWHGIEGSTQGRPQHVSFQWRGLAKKHLCPELPKISVRCEYPGMWKEVDNDAGLSFHVFRTQKHLWTAEWRRIPISPGATRCVIRIDRDKGSGGPIDSAPFAPAS